MKSQSLWISEVKIVSFEITTNGNLLPLQSDVLCCMFLWCFVLYCTVLIYYLSVMVFLFLFLFFTPQMRQEQWAVFQFIFRKALKMETNRIGISQHFEILASFHNESWAAPWTHRQNCIFTHHPGCWHFHTLFTYLFIFRNKHIMREKF